MLKMFSESFKNLFSKPETVLYPFEPSPEPKNYRGVIFYNEELCIFCDKCEDICPPGSILFEVVDVESNKKEYNYNPYLCIYCGACVEACPKADEGCLTQEKDRMPALAGSGEQVYKNEKLGYFINRTKSAKNLDFQWREIENKTKESREKLAQHKALKRKQKQEALKAKKASSE